MKKIGILDCGISNIASVSNALRHLGAEFVIFKPTEDFSSIGHLILPGVGSFAAGMETLITTGARDRIIDFVKSGKSLFGICLGMQFLASEGEEHGGAEGLNLIHGTVKKIDTRDSGLPVPHVGWNTLSSQSKSTLLTNIEPGDSFYFVHSYALTEAEPGEVIGYTAYSTEIPVIVQKDNVYGVQFHPEKSQKAGLNIMKNFIELC